MSTTNASGFGGPLKRKTTTFSVPVLDLGRPGRGRSHPPKLPSLATNAPKIPTVIIMVNVVMTGSARVNRSTTETPASSISRVTLLPPRKPIDLENHGSKPTQSNYGAVSRLTCTQSTTGQYTYKRVEADNPLTCVYTKFWKKISALVRQAGLLVHLQCRAGQRSSRAHGHPFQLVPLLSPRLNRREHHPWTHQCRACRVILRPRCLLCPVILRPGQAMPRPMPLPNF